MYDALPYQRVRHSKMSGAWGHVMVGGEGAQNFTQVTRSSKFTLAV
jgi:hypothetical protein